MNFFVSPPILSLHVPRFLLRRHIVSFFRKIAEWSQIEYLQAISFYEMNGNQRAVSKIKKFHSPITVLSSYPKFVDLCKRMVDDYVWNQLTRDEQRLLARAYELANK